MNKALLILLGVLLASTAHAELKTVPLCTDLTSCSTVDLDDLRSTYGGWIDSDTMHMVEFRSDDGCTASPVITLTVKQLDVATDDWHTISTTLAMGSTEKIVRDFPPPKIWSVAVSDSTNCSSVSGVDLLIYD